MIGTVCKGKVARFWWVFLCAAFLLGGCSTTRANRKDLPPVLAQDEVLRPYQKVAVLQVHRKRLGSGSDISPEDYAWVYEALREEACKIGADAVILPEVKVEVQNDYGFPSSEMLGKGIAIRFQ